MNFNPVYLHERQVSPEEVNAFRNEYLNLNEEIQKALKKGNHAPIGDGPIDCEGYLKAKTKIMWLMKEPYDTTKGESHENAKTGGWYFSRKFFEEKKIGSDRTTWYPIINVSHAILTGQKIWNQANRMSANNKDLIKSLFHIGYVNVQKLASTTREKTDNTSIFYAFEENKKWIDRQFKLLNPDIIIGANTLQGRIFEHFGLKGNRILKTDTNEAYVVDNKLFLHTKHPAQRKSKANYVNDILIAVEAWKSEVSNETIEN